MRLETLVNATDLTLWAERLDAQGRLPQLLRRLMYATAEKVLRTDIPSGEGTQLPGWDGIAVVEQGNAFLPSGLSVWEFSTRKDIRTKADEDYEKRKANPLGVSPSDATYVSVTPRSWAEKRAWQESRQAEGVWREVRAYDAHDLESWLEQAPAVHLWFSILLGKYPEAAVDLQSWWDDWSAATEPHIPPELVLAGRGEICQELHEWFDGTTATVALKSDCRDDALVVYAATAMKLPPEERERELARTVVANDVSAWNLLAASQSNLVLILNFPGDPSTIARALRAGQRAVVPLGGSDPALPSTLAVPRIPREEAQKILTDQGLGADKAHELAGLMHRSLTAFRRKLAVRPEVQQPDWASPANGHALLPALLAGAWRDDLDGDRGTVAALAHARYEDVGEVLVRWSNETDPPVHRTGEVWYTVSKEDAWSLLARYVTADDLEAFRRVIVDVLSKPDPQLDLPEGEQWKAEALGLKSQESQHLRQGLADTLALMAAQGDPASVAGGRTPGDVAATVVGEILSRANRDWRIWASCSGILPLLAEAAPNEFLRAVTQGLEGKTPVLLELFRDGHNAHGSSPHCGLLWALETVAWTADYVGGACPLLAELARLDPGGKLANRPANSLREIFRLWHPQTSASLDQRLRVLDAVCEREPDVGWDLLLYLLPGHQGIGRYTHTPRWRDWVPDRDIRVDRGEYVAAAREIAGRLLALVGKDGSRWRELLDRLDSLPQDLVKVAVDTLAALDVAGTPAQDALVIWSGLRELLHKQRSRPSFEGGPIGDVLPTVDQLYRRFQPQDQTDLYGWLFGSRIVLPQGRASDYKAYEIAVASARMQAVTDVCETCAIPGILRLAESVENPFLLGRTLGLSVLAMSEEDSLLAEHLDSPNTHRTEFARGIVVGRIASCGPKWVESKLTGAARNWSPGQKADMLMYMPHDGHTWGIVENEGPNVEAEYWRRIAPYWIESADVETAVSRFLRCGRPYTAAQVLVYHIEGQCLPTELIARTLEGMLETPPQDDPYTDQVSYYVTELMGSLAKSGEIEESRMARLEWAFLPVFDRHDYRPEYLHRELSRSPKLFSEVVSLVFRGEGEGAREVTPEAEAQAEQAWYLLESWRTVPGVDDGTIDADALGKWVRRARELLSAAGRLGIGDQQIGQVLSGSPSGEDGAWPHRVVCNVIEDVASSDLEIGLEVAVFNSRGVFWKSLSEGGTQERQLADRYDGYARARRDRWPRTTAMLRRIAERYRADARQEDTEAELREDLW